MTAQERLMATARRLSICAILTATAVAGLSACATPKPAPASKPAATAERVPPRERVSKAIEFLFQGKAAEARVQLVAALADQPANDVAVKLLRQIDTDPKVLLGEKSFSYRGRDGDTASSLAAAHLGDPLLFYALARYNQIEIPSQSLNGRTVMIPGEPKAAAPRPPPTAAAKPAPKSVPAPPGPQRNPARASELRSAGLVEMNRGAIDRAVSLLQQALSLDPKNLAIQRDVTRALRIQQTVRSR
jgi:hypothetical protein